MTTSAQRIPTACDQQRRKRRRRGRCVADEEHLEHAEHAADHVRRRGALEQRQPGDVDERVAEPEHGEGDAAATAVFGQTPISASGAPQSTIPSPKSEASRFRPTSANAASAPTTPADARRRVEQADARVAAGRAGRAR